MTVLARGNTKLGHSCSSFSLPAGDSCPGMTAFCEACYAMKGRMAMQQDRYARQMAMNPLELEAAILEDLRGLPRGHKVRIHASGDFYSLAYIAMWERIVSMHPERLFWAYTRSWRIPLLCAALERLERLPNIALWASTDSTTPEDVPAGWREARVVDEWSGGWAHCPEQTGRRPSCSQCGLCWNAKPGARLQFHLH